MFDVGAGAGVDLQDGNMIMMRGFMNNNHDNKPNVGGMEKSIVASLRDGVVVCFFLAKDGSMSVQVTTVASQTFELTSTGTVLMFPSKIHAKQKQSNSTSSSTTTTTSLNKEGGNMIHHQLLYTSVLLLLLLPCMLH